MKALILAGLVLLIAGCAEDGSQIPNPSQPDVLVQNLASVVTSFRCSKLNCEQRATTIKGQLKFRKKNETEALYKQARVAHNGAIAYITTALGIPETANTQAELQDWLSKADDARRMFLEQYEVGVEVSELPRANSSGMCNATGGIPVELVSTGLNALLEAIRIGDARLASQLAWIRRELKECEWREWESLPGGRRN